MAIERYNGNGVITTGGNFASMAATPNAGASGASLARLGSAITGLAQDVFEADEQFRAKAEAQAEADYRLEQTDKLIDFKLELEKELIARKEGAVDGATGFTSSYEEYVAKRSQEYMKEHFHGRENDKELALRFKATADGFISDSARFEGARRIEWRGGVMAKQLDSLSANIGSEVARLNPYKDLVDDDGGFDGNQALANVYARAEAEFERTTQEQFADNPRAAEHALSLGKQRLQREWLGAWAAANPKEYLELHDGAFTGSPRKEARQDFKDLYHAAQAGGVDHRLMAAIYGIESDFGRIDRPWNKGRLMSSAVGPFQFLKKLRQEYGLSEDDARDMKKAGPVFAKYAKGLQGMLAKAGVPVNEVTTYMAHNIGPAATIALMRADPSSDGNAVLARTWRGKMSPKLYIQHMVNNPSFYGPRHTGTSVAGIYRRYENAIKQRMSEADKHFEGTEVDSDTRVRDALQQITPFAPDGIDAKSAADIYKQALVARKEAAQKNEATITANAFLSGTLPKLTMSPEHRKDIDTAIQVDGEAIVQGDPSAHSGLIAFADKGHVPASGARALTESLRQPGNNNPAKGAAFLTAARIAQDYPTAWSEAAVDADVKKRVDMFRALVDVDRIPHDMAVRIVDREHSPEGEATRKAMGDRIRLELKGGKKTDVEGADVTWATIEKHFDGKYGSSMWSDADATQVQKDVAVSSYNKLYEHYRLEGHDPAISGSLALSQMERMWGVSTIDGTTRLTPAPIEKSMYPAIGGNHDWITKQAGNYVAAELMDRGQWGGAHWSEGNLPEFRIVPTPETMQDVRNGKSRPRYAVVFRRKDGLLDRVPGLIQFDPEVAEAEHMEAFYEKVERERKSNAATQRQSRPVAPKGSMVGVGKLFENITSDPTPYRKAGGGPLLNPNSPLGKAIKDRADQPYVVEYLWNSAPTDDEGQEGP